MKFIDLEDIGYFIYMQEQENQKDNDNQDNGEREEDLKTEQATSYLNKI